MRLFRLLLLWELMRSCPSFDDSPVSFGDTVVHEPEAVLAETADASSSGPHLPETSAQVLTWNDDTTLEELMFYKRAQFPDVLCHKFDAESSEISDISSEFSSTVDDDSDSVELDRKAELDGERNAGDLVAPSDLTGKKCFRHCKSQKLHFVEKCVGGNQFFRCGRKLNQNYEPVEVAPAFTAHGCMTCFGWSDTREASGSDD